MIQEKNKTLLTLNKKSLSFCLFLPFHYKCCHNFILSPIPALLHFQLPARQRLSVVTKAFNHTTVFTARLSDLHLNQPLVCSVCVCKCVCVRMSVQVILVYVSVSTKAIKSTQFPCGCLSSPPTNTQRRSSTELPPASALPFERQNILKHRKASPALQREPCV